MYMIKINPPYELDSNKFPKNCCDFLKDCSDKDVSQRKNCEDLLNSDFLEELKGVLNLNSI